MSPAAGRRFLVKCFDYEEWGVIVEAASTSSDIIENFLHRSFIPNARCSGH